MMRFILTVLLLTFSCPPAHADNARAMAGPLTGEVTGVLDGDTVAVRVRIWIDQTIETRVRIDGIDAPELHGKCAAEKKKAQAARAALEKLLQGQMIFLTDIQYEKYAGRVLASARTADGTLISDYMIKNGLARPYGGEKRATWCA